MKKSLLFLGTILLGLLLVVGIMGRFGEFFKWLSIILLSFIGLAIYLLPSIIAIKKKSRYLQTVLILNIFFGWTLFGWGIALLRSLRNA